MTINASVATGSQPLASTCVSTENFVQADPCLLVPINPRAKLIQWSVSRRLEIVSMIGDFTELGIIVPSESNEERALELKQRQVFEMLQDEQVQGLFDQFQAAMLKGCLLYTSDAADE